MTYLLSFGERFSNHLYAGHKPLLEYPTAGEVEMLQDYYCPVAFKHGFTTLPAIQMDFNITNAYFGRVYHFNDTCVYIVFGNHENRIFGKVLSKDEWKAASDFEPNLQDLLEIGNNKGIKTTIARSDYMHLDRSLNILRNQKDFTLTEVETARRNFHMFAPDELSSQYAQELFDDTLQIRRQ